MLVVAVSLGGDHHIEPNDKTEVIQLADEPINNSHFPGKGDGGQRRWSGGDACLDWRDAIKGSPLMPDLNFS